MITNNTITSNTATDNGGAVYNTIEDGYANATLNYNHIENNTVIGVYTEEGLINAENNWWGTNFNGTNPESAGMTNFNIQTWLS